jgi:uncharacterized protein YybS (DUF2232 family)
VTEMTPPASAPASAPARTGPTAEPRAVGILAAGSFAALLFAATLWVPVAFVLAAISPLPLIVLRLRTSAAFSLLAATLAVALVAGAFAPVPAAIFLGLFVGPGLVIGDTMARGRGLLRGCAWAFLLLSVQIGGALLLAGDSLGAFVLEPFETVRSAEFANELRTKVSADQVVEITNQLTQMRDFIAVVFPALYIIAGAMVVMLNAILLRAYLLRRDPGWLEGGEFEGIRWPSVLSLLFVMSGAAVAVPAARAAAYNVLLVLAFFFILQGLAVTAFYAHRLAGPPFLRAAVVLLVLVNPWALYILALLGLFDIFINFRKWALPPEAREG